MKWGIGLGNFSLRRSPQPYSRLQQISEERVNNIQIRQEGQSDE